MLVWYAQEIQSSCVAACVRMALGARGLQLAEAVVRDLIGHTRLGTSLGLAQVKLVEGGAIAQFHDDWSLDDMRDTLRAGHHLDGPELRSYGVAAFMTAWETAGREALVIEAPPVL